MIIDAVVAEGNDPRHSGAGWHLTLQLTNGDIISLPYVEHGHGVVKLDLETDGEETDYLFVPESQIVWAIVDFRCHSWYPTKGNLP